MGRMGLAIYGSLFGTSYPVISVFKSIVAMRSEPSSIFWLCTNRRNALLCAINVK